MEYRCNFVTLQTGMKGILTKVTAMLLIVWYSMSIIGFGIHTCSGSGESFVVTFVEGLECEDIHPEHHCTKGSCCSHSHSCCDTGTHTGIGPKSCCTSDYQVLALTGTVSDEKNSFEDLFYSDYICSNIFESSADIHDLQFVPHYPADVSCLGRMPDIQSLLGVWRI